jgi:mono/diheme cytochrome c family protein
MIAGRLRRTRVAAALICAAAMTACVVARGDPPPPTAAAAPLDARPLGQQLYGRHCLSCHQADGGGVPRLQPAIKGGTWVTGDPRALAMFVMTGGFDSAARKNSDAENVMPPFNQLPDAELAEILTYIRAKFGNGASPVGAGQVAAARATLP